MAGATCGALRNRRAATAILSPVLVATAIEAERVVVVDGFKRVRIATDRGDVMIWVRRIAVDAPGAKVAMVAANAGHGGLCDLEEAWIVRSLCRERRGDSSDVCGRRTSRSRERSARPEAP